VGRATSAPSKEQPHPVGLPAAASVAGAVTGTVWPSAASPAAADSASVLQRHVAFFDRQASGVLWPWTTAAALRDAGFNPFLAVAMALVIHAGLSWWSLDSFIPHPGLPIYVKNIHRCKHGSDSGTYDTEGRFVPQHFEDVFARHARSSPLYLTGADLARMAAHSRCVADPFGWAAHVLEWGSLYLLAARNGRLHKEDDGTLFYHLANERRARTAKRN
ncbi:hypothetical protein HK405_005959, partial [Cladochytrium tenue]